MRFDTGFSNNFNFSYRTSTLVINDTSSSYVNNGSGMAMISISTFNSVFMITRESVALFDKVNGVTDANSVPLFVENDVEFDMYIVGTYPEIDPFSRIIGYKSVLARQLPRTVLQRISDIRGAVISTGG